MAKTNYLNNKDILLEIHKSKMSFCWVKSQNHYDFDVIVNHVDEIDDNAIQTARINKSQKLKEVNYKAAVAEYSGPANKKPRQKEFIVDPDSFALEELTFRVMDFDHIPDEPGRKNNPKNIAETKVKLNFLPFKHYAFKDDELIEVARSHWNGGPKSGKFDLTKGTITPKLGHMFLKLVERYSQRANWRGYTYVDEMRGQALVQLAQIGLQFNEAKSDNPFAYYTAAITNSFTRVLNIEKRNQNIRDDLLIEAGQLPSFTRQIKHEEEVKANRELAKQENTNLDESI